MDNLIIGKKLTRTKAGRFKTAAENITPETINKKVENKLSNLVKVRVFLKSDLKTYFSNPTWIYVTEKKLKSKNFQLRTIPRFLKNNS